LETKPRLVTAAHAYVPGELNLAHVASTYLPADLYHRLSAFFGVSSRFVTGLDIHGRHAQRELASSGVGRDELAARYGGAFLGGLRRLKIEPTEFVFTDDPRLAPLMKEVFARLHSGGVIYRKPSSSFYCGGCKEFLSKSEISVASDAPGGGVSSLKLWDGEAAPPVESMVCGMCRRRTLEVRSSEQWFMKLTRDAELAELHAAQPYKVARKFLEGVFADDFREWEFTREDYYGTPMPLDPDKSLYLWCDSLFSKFLGLAGDYEGMRAALEGTRLVTFFAKNVIQYYGLVLPTLLRRGFRLPRPDLQFSVRGFCDYEKSRAMLALEDALSLGSPDELRFYCAYTAPDDILDFSLTPERLKLTVNNILVRTFGRYLERAATLIAGHGTLARGAWDGAQPPVVKLLRGLYEAGGVRKILLELEQFVKRESRFLAGAGGAPDDAAVRRVAQGFVLTYNVLSCYVPTLIEEYRLFERDEKGFLIASPAQRFEARGRWSSLLKT
jgi:methionyl-tRNA synthetase